MNRQTAAHVFSLPTPFPCLRTYPFAKKAVSKPPPDDDAVLRRLFRQFGAGVRSALKAGVHPMEYPACKEAYARIRRITTRRHTELKKLQKELRIPDEVVELLGKADQFNSDERYHLEDVRDAPTTVRLEDVVGSALDHMRTIVDPVWLNEQRRKPYRMRYDQSPQSLRRIHLVGRERLPSPTAPPRPHRLAHMLLLAEDFLAERHDQDFHEASSLLPEFVTLGNSLPLVRKLGPEAERKLATLGATSDRDCATTVYELLVGAALVRMGRDAEMLVASAKEKSPDFVVHDTLLPAVVECKRRYGLPESLVKEARHVESLYDACADIFERHHLCVEVSFDRDVSEITPDTFRATLSRLADSGDDDVSEQVAGGTIRALRLSMTRAIPATRVFSPTYLQSAFDWDPWKETWDGMIAEIDPTGVVADAVDCPRCLKWRCMGEKSLIARARGVTSLWGDATKQIRDGEVGLIYIAYTEQMRPEHADARTQHLITATKEWYYKYGPQIPFTIVNRLYPQCRGNGGPDFIESVMPMISTDWEYLLEDFPVGVFCPSDLMPTSGFEA